MDGMKLLCQARQAGLVVFAQGDRLIIRGPRQAEELALKLLACKLLVLQALAMENSESRTVVVDPAPEDLPPPWRERWEERVHIMIHDGKVHQEHAEAIALADVLDLMKEEDRQSQPDYPRN